MNSSAGNNSIFKFCSAFLAALLIGAIFCTAGFGLGLLTGQLSGSSRVQASPLVREISPEDSAIGPAPPNLTRISAPANFDVFWEAVGRITDNFDGEVPSGSNVTLAAVEGIMSAVGECSPSRSSQIVQITPPRAPRSAPENFDFFWKTVNDLYADCGSGVPAPDALVYSALNGIIARLEDRHTSLLPPARAEQFRIDLESSFEGIGASVNEAEGGGVLIVYPFPGSPAERSGIRQFDVVVAVDGQDITEFTLDESVRLIRGPAGSQVVLTVRRQGTREPFDITVTRARIEIPIIDSEITEDNLLYVALFDFSTRAAEELRRVLTAGVDAGVRGVILDLRGNPGGRLDVSIEIASMFINDGVIVSETGHRNFEHRARGRAVIGDLPLAVLVDAGSASASEIVAGAIQDYGRGLLIGETTFGKGSVQSLFDLSDGSLLRVTTARWFTPLGRQIEGEGLFPDQVVSAGDDPQADPQLEAAVRHLLEQ